MNNEVVYTLFRETGCDGYFKVFSSSDIEKVSRSAILYSVLGDVKLQVEIDGRHSTMNELENYAELVEEKIEELSHIVR